jgi:hypothetical protein
MVRAAGRRESHPFVEPDGGLVCVGDLEAQAAEAGRPSPCDDCFDQGGGHACPPVLRCYPHGVQAGVRVKRVMWRTDHQADILVVAAGDEGRGVGSCDCAR